MTWVKVADDSSIGEARIVPIDVAGKELVLIRHRGMLHALDRRCYHMMGDLSEGKLTDRELTCPRCGSIFDVETGKNILGPRLGVVRMHCRDERAYHVKVEGGAVFVRID